jgi:hypothetical protein
VTSKGGAGPRAETQAPFWEAAYADPEASAFGPSSDEIWSTDCRTGLGCWIWGAETDGTRFPSLREASAIATRSRSWWRAARESWR